MKHAGPAAKARWLVACAAALACITATPEIYAQPVAPPGSPFAGQGGGGDMDEIMQPLPLTPGQKIAASLPPPDKGVMRRLTPLSPNDPLPSKAPRDLQGVWNHARPIEFRIQNDMFGDALPYTEAGANTLKRRLLAGRAGTPYQNASVLCRPPGQPWQLDINFPFLIVQNDNYVEFIFQEYHGRWNIAFDPAIHPAKPGGEYMGRSIGHWDGNTLVVETTGFKDALWMEGDGTPVSAQGKLVQRIRKVAEADATPYLEVMTTVIDPKNYTKPWTVVRHFAWQPQAAQMTEYNCEEAVGAPGPGIDAGIVAEPGE